MDLKTYQGNSLAEALEKVKKDLGREAVILHTRTVRKGGILGIGTRTFVEITASRSVNVLHPAERARPFRDETSDRVRDQSRQAGQGRDRDQNRDREGTVCSPVKPPLPYGRSSDGRGSEGRGPEDSTRSSRPLSADPTFSLREEMSELRSLVRELLNRPAPVGWGPNTDVPAELMDYYRQLIQSAVADELARDVIAKAKARLAECQARLAARAEQKGGAAAGASQGKSVEAVLRDLVPAVLLETVERLLPPTEPIRLPGDGRLKLVALVGPTGVGKTTTIAKLAAHFKLREHKRVGLITIDTYRIAAVDQLKAYADILNVPLQVVLTPADMAATVESLRGLDVVLIDTSGRSQNDAGRLGELRVFLDAARAAAAGKNPDGDGQDGGGLETHLVLSCTSHPGQLVQVAEKFAPLGVDRVVFTKLDEAVGLGVILNVANRLNLQLSYLTTGQDVPDDMEIGHRRRIAELILNRAEVKRAHVALEHVA
ncbi:MAG: hypothetical protein AMXMBFR83_17350 [Phycisphaerae bacterium]